MADGTVTVALADDDALATLAMKALLSHCDRTTLLWTARSGEQTLAHCLQDSQSPDVLILAVPLNSMPAEALCERIRREGIKPAILALTTQSVERHAAALALAGAQGILSKNDYRDLPQAIRALAAGGTFAPETLRATARFESAAAAHARLASDKPSGIAALSPVETEILKLAARGLESKEIAKRLGMSPSTERTHVMRIKAKLHAGSLTSAILAWTRRLHT